MFIFITFCYYENKILLAVAADAGLSQDAVSKALASMIDVITTELKKR